MDNNIIDSGDDYILEKALAAFRAGMAAELPIQLAEPPEQVPPQVESPPASLVNDEPPIPVLSDVNEDTIATQFAIEYQGKLKYCEQLKAWFEWDPVKKLWNREQRRRAFHYARSVCRTLNTKNKAAIAKATTASGVERFARADPVFATVAEEWDQGDMIAGAPGQLLFLDSGAKKNQPDQNYMITKSLGVAPAPGRALLWDRLLEEWTAGDKEVQRFLQQICGYCLTGKTHEHVMIFIYGPGGNGKSVFLNTVMKILGDYAVMASIDTFTVSRNDRHSTEIAMLRGARLVAVSETEEGRAWKESLVKSLTGGDPVTARFMRQDNFTYIPQFKLVVVGNHKPRLRNVDEAMRRRLCIIPFIHQPAVKDPHLEEELKSEYPQILNWMIEGCQDWLANGLIRPAIVQATTDEYFEAQDLFAQWINDCCETGINRSGASSELYANWKAYAEMAGETAGNSVRFASNMERRGYCKRRTMHGMVFDEINLKPPKEEHLPYKDN